MIRVLIVDDQPLIRRALVDLLGSISDVAVVGEAIDGADAVARARELVPDVILTDIRMPVVDGIAATSIIANDPALRDAKVLILTTFEDDENLVAALRAGASGFIGKGAAYEDIVRAIRAVHDGGALLSPEATRSLIEKYLTQAPTQSASDVTGVDELTTREREVLALVARGASNADIGEALEITESTAKTHVNRVMSKVGAHDRAGLVVIGYETGIVHHG